MIKLLFVCHGNIGRSPMAGDDSDGKIHLLMEYTDHPGEVAVRGIQEILRSPDGMCWPGVPDCWSKCSGMVCDDESTKYDEA